MEAVSGEYGHEWKRAMDVEMNNMVSNDVWEVVERPDNCKVIGSKWVFKVKLDEFGNPERFKACLVAQGFKKAMKLD